MLATIAQLEDLLATPSESDIAAMAQLSGDLLVLGAGGKMGPSLVRRARRAILAAGTKSRVIAVARFSDPALAGELENDGIVILRADLTDSRHVAALPVAPNVIFMAGRKFGSTGNEPLTWAVNAWAPALVAERFAGAKIVAFSTGNVYPIVPVRSGGATEQTPPAPIGEYAQSALARERMFEYFSNRNGTPVTLLRLNYAIDLRYGVLHDIGLKIFERRPIDLTMGHVNVIWQGDANSVCLRSFALCSSPARILNLTGLETLAVRTIAARFGSIFGVEPILEGEEAPTALLSNASECARLLGPPETSLDEMLSRVAHWISIGGATYNKPTHFEARDGRF
jgi:nucleoside-diphosphate-sugar epimerase